MRMGGKSITLPMHFSKWGANRPAIIDLPQFMHSRISFATGGWVCPNISTIYLPLVSPLWLGSDALARASADNLNSSSSSSKLRSSPNLAIRCASDATSTIIESRRSPKISDDSCKGKPKYRQISIRFSLYPINMWPQTPMTEKSMWMTHHKIYFEL